MVTSSTIFTESWNSIFNIIQNNVSDPTGKNRFLYGGFPDKIWDNKSEFPVVVIHPIESPGSETIVLPRGTKVFSLRSSIEIYSTNTEQLDSMTDDVFNAIESNETTLYENNINNFELSSVDADTIERGKFRVHFRRLDWDFEFNKVS